VVVHDLDILRIPVSGADPNSVWSPGMAEAGASRYRIEAICRQACLEPPAICTPIEFVEE